MQVKIIFLEKETVPKEYTREINCKPKRIYRKTTCLLGYIRVEQVLLVSIHFIKEQANQKSEPKS